MMEPIIRQTDSFYNGKRLCQFKWQRRADGMKYNREQLAQKIQNYNNQLNEQGFGGEIVVTFLYSEGWRSGRPTKVGDDISLPVPDEGQEEPGEYPSAIMYLTRSGRWHLRYIFGRIKLLWEIISNQNSQ